MGSDHHGDSGGDGGDGDRDRPGDTGDEPGRGGARDVRGERARVTRIEYFLARDTLVANVKGVFIDPGDGAPIGTFEVIVDTPERLQVFDLRRPLRVVFLQAAPEPVLSP